MDAIPTPGLTFVKVVDSRHLVPKGGDVLWRWIVVVVHLESLPPNVCNVLRSISCSNKFLADLDLLLDDFCHRHCISLPPCRVTRVGMSQTASGWPSSLPMQFLQAQLKITPGIDTDVKKTDSKLLP
jgi:hypothetical protein